HPTTRLCLEWLARDAAVAGKQVLDYGCGSGILAIAAVKLGAHAVTAIDIDVDACRVAQENAARNGCGEITIVTPNALHQGTFDLIVANLLWRPVLDLQPEFSARLERNGRIGLSGLLRDQVPSVLDAYAGPFKMDLPQFNEEWALITGTRR
ncbi:MAG: 50S ribosomal protein L11 methyltransferase, partial [Gammaproteobacteria bacterium]